MLLPRPSEFDYCFVDTDRRRYIRARVMSKLHRQELDKCAKNPLWKLGESLASPCPNDHDKAFLWLGVCALAFLVGGLLVGAILQDLLPALSGWVLCLLIVAALASPFYLGRIALERYHRLQPLTFEMEKVEFPPSLNATPPPLLESEPASISLA